MNLLVLAFGALLALGVCHDDDGVPVESKASIKKVLDTEAKNLIDEARNEFNLREFTQAHYEGKTRISEACKYFIEKMQSKVIGVLQKAESKIIEAEKAVKDAKKKTSNTFSELFGKILGK